jgi:DNA-directed RNA polymerase subunit RPC12/RpoP
MVIRFLCPNGHKIHCPDDRAGQPAKCPRCGVRFLVPGPPEFYAPGPSGPQSPAPEGEAGGAEASMALAGQEDLIEFACPNGHRLHGPRSLAGAPAQCPECGVHFRIPASEEFAGREAEVAKPEVALADSTEGTDAADQREESGIALPPGGQEAASPQEPQAAEVASSATGGGPGLAAVPRAVPVAVPVQGHPVTSVHPLADLLSRLWPERGRGAVIELHLSDGQTLVPASFSPGLSLGNVGVFALTEPDGSHTVTAVAWDRVARLVVRGVGQLPDGFID